MEGDEPVKCGQCGAEIKNGESFCRVCGARVPSSEAAEAVRKEDIKKPEPAVEPTEKPEKKSKKSAEKPERKRIVLPKKVLVIALIAVAAIVAVIVLVMIFGGGGKSELSLDPDRPFAVEHLDSAVVYSPDGDVIALADGYARALKSAWNSTIVLQNDRGITICSSDAVTEIETGYAGCMAVVSGDGSRVAYIAEAEGTHEEAGGDLYVYSVEEGEITYIDSNVIPNSVALSPNGERLAYSIFDIASDTSHALVGRSTGEGERLLDCETILGLSDDGTYLYFINNDRFYVARDGVRTRLCEADALPRKNGIVAGDYEPMLTNSTGSELLFAAGDGVYFVKDAVCQKVSGSSGLIGPLGLENDTRQAAITPMRVESFGDTILMVGGTLYDVSEEIAEVAVCSAATGSASGRKVAYIDKNGNICISDGDAALGEIDRVRPDETPTALFADASLDRIYFTNARGELWRLNGEKTEMVSADASDFRMSGDGTLYFLYDGVVLCRASGSERVSVERVEDFLVMESAPQGVVVKLRSGEARYYRPESEVVILGTDVAAPAAPEENKEG